MISFMQLVVASLLFCLSLSFVRLNFGQLNSVRNKTFLKYLCTNPFDSQTNDDIDHCWSVFLSYVSTRYLKVLANSCGI